MLKELLAENPIVQAPMAGVTGQSFSSDGAQIRLRIGIFGDDQCQGAHLPK